MKRRTGLAMAMLLAALSVTGCGGNTSKEEPAAEQKTEAAAQADGEEKSGGSDEVQWPTGAITINVTGKAGGSTDLVTRTFADYYSKVLGVPVVITNDDGILQFQNTHDAKPDGYTMCVGATGFLVYGYTGTLDFGLEGYDPISLISRDETFGLWVTKESGFQTLDDLVNYMKENPGKVNFGIKTATSVHLEAVGFLKAAGCEANVVDAGGDAERVTALLGGQIDVTIEPLGSMKGYLDEGQAICLGTFQKESCELSPDIPTVYSQGYDFTFPANFQALMLPPGVDPAIVEKASAAALEVLQNPEYEAAINAMGAIVVPEDYEQTNDYLKKANELVGELVKDIL